MPKVRLARLATDVHPELIVHGLRFSDFPDDRLSIRGIFVHHRNWERYTLEHADDLRPV